MEVQMCLSFFRHSSGVMPDECRKKKKNLNTFALSSPQYLSSRKKKKTTKLLTTPYDIHSSEQTLPRHMRTKLAQLKANESSLFFFFSTFIRCYAGPDGRCFHAAWAVSKSVH